MDTWSTKAAVRECQISNTGELTVTERLATLLDSGEFADVSIRVGQGTQLKTFKAHRLLLATASQPLYKLVSTVQHGHADLNTFRVTDVEPEAFKNVLTYIYTDTVKINSIVDAFALLKAGKKWSLNNMNNKTIDYIDEFLDEFIPSTEEKKNEIFDILHLSEPHSKELFEKCLNIVIKYAKDIIPCQGFLRLDDKTIRCLFAHPNFCFENQLVLFESIRDWGMNQILLRGLNPAQLHPIIEDLLTHVDFAEIKDNEFMGTILPSECLGRAEIIAFFMTRGMEIPRDMGYNNNNNEGTSIVQNGEVQDFKRVCRYKRGYRLPHKEIYQEHEVRFRVDHNIKLLGICFGFLFSNTDMGVTVNVQGPFERVQWTDMAQTYCRVSFEKMKTADLKLMLNEPARLEANHSYKVLVKITRMTAGSSDVELWGGKDGQSTMQTDEAKFYFMKAACEPSEEPEARDLDSKQSMLTELLYVIDDSPVVKPEEVTARRRRPQFSEIENTNEEIKTPQTPPTPSYMRNRPTFTTSIDSDVSSILPRRRNIGETTSYRRWQPSSTTSSTSDSSSLRRYRTRDKTPEKFSELSRKTPEADISSYLRKRTSPTRERKISETPSYLRPRTTTTSTSSDTPFGDRLSRMSNRSALPWSSSRGITATNDYGSSLNSSRYGTGSTTASPSSYLSKYSRDNTSSSRSTGATDTKPSSTSSIYRRDSTTGSSTPSYRREPSVSRLGRETSITKREPSISKTSSLSSTTSPSSTASVLSRYRDNAVSQIGSRFERSRESPASRYGSTYGSSTYGTGSYGSSGSKYGSSYSRFR